jgi:hypothetical protein
MKIEGFNRRHWIDPVRLYTFEEVVMAIEVNDELRKSEKRPSSAILDDTIGICICLA